MPIDPGLRFSNRDLYAGLIRRADWRSKPPSIHMTEPARFRLRASGPGAISWWLLALFVATVIEGAFRKWLLPDSLQALAYGAKDVIALVFVLQYPLPGSATTLRNIRLAVFVVGVLLIPALFLGALNNPLAALSTYKNAVLWPLLAIHLAPRLRSEIVDGFLLPLTVATCCMALLGAAQYYSPGDSFLNRYAWRDFDAYVPVATFGELGGIRATGTFSYIAGMVMFAEFGFSFALWRSVGRISNRQRVFAAVTAAAAVCCALESGSRAPVVVFAVLLAAATVFTRRARVFLRIWAVLLVSGLAMLFVLGPEILESFVNRWQTAGDTTIGRITGEDLKADPWQLIAADPVGLGLGRATGFGAKTTILSGSSLITFDDGGSSLVLESGLAGLIALWTISGSLIVVVFRGLTGPSYDLRCVSALLGVVPTYWIWSGTWYNHTATAFTWLSIAIWLSYLKPKSRCVSPARPNGEAVCLV